MYLTCFHFSACENHTVCAGRPSYIDLISLSAGHNYNVGAAAVSGAFPSHVPNLFLLSRSSNPNVGPAAIGGAFPFDVELFRIEKPPRQLLLPLYDFCKRKRETKSDLQYENAPYVATVKCINKSNT